MDEKPKIRFATTDASLLMNLAVLADAALGCIGPSPERAEYAIGLYDGVRLMFHALNIVEFMDEAIKTSTFDGRMEKIVQFLALHYNAQPIIADQQKQFDATGLRREEMFTPELLEEARKLAETLRGPTKPFYVM